MAILPLYIVAGVLALLCGYVALYAAKGAALVERTDAMAMAAAHEATGSRGRGRTTCDACRANWREILTQISPRS